MQTKTFLLCAFFPFVAACTQDDVDPLPARIRVLTANIGNPDTDDPNYALRLSYQAYEDYVGARIRDLNIDVAFLQEVLPPTKCGMFTETDPARTCYDAANRAAPIQRILGPDYSIVCDARDHVECIGIHTRLGTLEGLEPGGFKLEGATTPELPLPGCSYFAGECDDTKCDAESTVSAVTVETADGPVRVVHVHPNAPGTNASGFYTGEPCRYEQLRQVFEGDDALIGTTRPVIVAGDFNMDPESFASQREADLWNAHVGDSMRFTHLGPPRQDNGRWYNTRTIFAIDHVIAEGLQGTCQVHGVPGIEDDPNVLPRLDDGFDFSQVPNGAGFTGKIDHASISCTLTY